MPHDNSWPKAAAKFEAQGIHSPSQLLKMVNRPGETAVALSWQPGEKGRNFRQAGWYVVQQGVPTDPTGPWYHHGNKFFPRDDKEKALAYVVERYGYTDWVSIPGFRLSIFPGWVRDSAYGLYLRAPAIPDLKVYSYSDFESIARVLYAEAPNNQVRVIVAVKSMAEVARITGKSEYFIRNEGFWTSNDEEIQSALEHPGEILFRPLNAGPGTPWTVKPREKA